VEFEAADEVGGTKIHDIL